MRGRFQWALAFASMSPVAGSAEVETLVLDDSPGLGLVFEGIGAISGGGATSRLLLDYDEGVASDILDYMFKPNFALSLQILKVEIGGDTDSTEGAEPSHMHDRGDENYERGYEWWLMKEAKKRNPDIKLYGLPWGWPGWLDPSASSDDKATNAFANPNETANYTLQWLLAAKRVHNLTIDFVGQWNERDAPAEYAEALRRAVAAHAPWTQVLDRMVHYPGSGSTDTPGGGNKGGSNKRNDPDPHSCQLAGWNASNRGWVDEEGSTYDRALPSKKGGDQESARCLARVVNRGYINQCRTATIQWFLIDSFYSYLPWHHCGVGIANTPWSGHYEFRSPLWALAHTTQFSAIGWRYLRHDSGVGLLPGGGSYVTRVSPDGKAWSLVVEKMAPEDSSCTRGSNPPHNTTNETVSFQVKGGLSAATKLYVWYSDLNQELDGPNMFVQKDPIDLGEHGTFQLTINRGEIYTVTTLATGFKGSHEPPAPAPFPTSFTDDFEAARLHSPPKYWYDQMGAWEVQPNPKGDGQVMRQVSTVWPACWGYSCSGPHTFFGPDALNDSIISMDVMLEDDAEWTLNDFTISTDGEWSFANMASGHAKSGHAKFEKNAWHHVTYRASADWAVVALDGKVLVGQASTNRNILYNDPFAWGSETPPPDSGTSPGLSMQLSRYIFASVDNLQIAPASSAGNTVAGTGGVTARRADSLYV